MQTEMSRQMDMSMKFHYLYGAVTHISNCHDTGWRTLPYALCTQNMEHPADIELSGGRKIKSAYGTTFVIPSGVPHRIKLRAGGESISRWAHFELTIFETVDALSLHKLPMVFKGAVAQEMGDLCEEMSKIHGDSSLEGMARIKALGFQLAILAFKNSKPMDNFNEVCELYRRIAPCLKLIENSKQAALSLEEMAKSCNLSVSRFSSLFKSATGKSPSRYQAKARLSKAKSLLLMGNLQIAEIARELGYNDQFHFSKMFKGEFGISPKFYREKGKDELRRAIF